MKLQTNLVNIVLKVFLSLMLTAPLFSCANLDEVWEKFEEEDARLDSLEGRLDSLESSLNNQIKALDEILSGKVTISECKKNDDGSTTITLTDETSFTVYPKSTEYSTLLTYVEEDGVKYWAFYNAKGKVTVMTDKEGNKIPVEAELPVVEEVDGEFILSIGGNEYTTGYTPEDVVTVFSDYELNEDETGNVYSVTFTFGEDMTFTISVADYKGFSFHMVGDVNNKVIKEFFVKAESTARLKAGLEGVVDYVMQIPDGWRVKEVTDELTGELFLDVTAPADAAVTSGAAVAAGDLKVVAVLEDGKSMVAKLELTTVPFKKFTTTSTNAVIEKYNGVDKVLFGLTTFAAYDKDAIVAGADAMITAGGKGVSETDVDILLSELLGAELIPGDRYVLWALPVFYDETGDDVVWIPDADLMFTREFGDSEVVITVDEVLFNDATVSVKIAGVTEYYGGIAVKSDNVLTEIVYDINNDLVDSYTEPMTYTGSAFAFPAEALIEPVTDETYITWVVPVEDGKTEYSVEDIVYEEYTLPAVQSGGTIAVTAGTAEVTRTTVNVTLTAEGAARIYYAFLPKKTADRYKSDQSRIEYLLNEGTIVNETSVTATASDLSPDTDITLFAIAVDSKGKYASVTVSDYKTKPLEFSDLVVSAAIQENSLSDTKATAVVTVTGGEATGYAYWIGKTTDEFWLSGTPNTGEENKKTAAELNIALYPTSTAVTRAMTNYPMEGNVITMTGLTPGSDYYLIILAKDSSEKYSRAYSLKFATLGADLGTLVTSSNDKWTTTKAWIVDNLEWSTNEFIKSGEFATYAFDIKIPTDLTAFIAPFTPDFDEYPEVADQIIYIEKACMESKDRPVQVDASTVPDWIEYDPVYGASLPMWVDDNGNEHGGSLFSPYNTYVHGAADWKGVTFFSSAGHNEATCPMWDSGECSQHRVAVEKFNNYRSIEYWRTHIEEDFNEPQYDRPLTDPDKIEAAAQAYHKFYSYFFEGLEPVIYVNDGEPLHIYYHDGIGPDDQGEVRDMITVVLKDNQGNYYEPMYIPVENHWK